GAALAARCGQAVAERARELRATRLATLHPMLRLPLASLAFPVLRQRPRPELDAFLDAIEAMVHVDGQVSVFEYGLSRLLQVQVREALDPSRHVRFGRRKATGVRAEFATLLAVLAQAGHPGQPQAAQRAYLAGLQRVLPRDHLPYAPPAAGVQALDAVWEPLDALAPPAKQVLVEALVDAVSHDGQVSVAEAELLRTVCGVLHCPLPALLSEAR
ncbi:MAG TPA: peptidase M48 Ste24p, partial [Pseudoxanthomonas sp.]|nr:peptidase M48 Ste24p [Pseudoxanthomonas sp.]